AAADATQLRLADGRVLRVARGAARRRRARGERRLRARHRRAARAAVKAYLQSYSLLHHYAHVPGFDVFAFLERAAAARYDGGSSNVNGPGYRQLSGTSPAHVARVRKRLEALGLACDLETSGTAPAHLDELTELCERLGAPRLRTYLRHEGTAPEQLE